MEYRVHHHLEGGWQIGKTEKHDSWLKEPFWSKEGCFPFITIFNMYIIVSPSDVKLGEQSAPAEAINGLRNERGDVLILLGPLVDWSIVLYQSQLSVFLFDKEEVGSIWAPGFMDCFSP
jgi:hypothetical protein